MFCKVAVFAMSIVAVIANGDGLCIDLEDYFDKPFKLFNKTRGIGLKLGSPYDQTGFITYGLVATYNESEALEVIWKPTRQLVLVSDPSNHLYWPNYRSGTPFMAKNKAGTLVDWH